MTDLVEVAKIWHPGGNGFGRALLKEGEATGIRKGRLEGRLEAGRQMALRVAARTFDADAVAELAAALDEITDPDRLDEVADWIFESDGDDDLLDRVRKRARPMKHPREWVTLEDVGEHWTAWMDKAAEEHRQEGRLEGARRIAIRFAERVYGARVVCLVTANVAGVRDLDRIEKGAAMMFDGAERPIRFWHSGAEALIARYRLEGRLEVGRQMTLRFAARAFGSDVVAPLSAALDEITDPKRIEKIAQWILECYDDDDLLTRVREEDWQDPPEAQQFRLEGEIGGIRKGRLEAGRRMALRFAKRTFDADAVEELEAALDAITDPDRFEKIADWIFECDSADDLLDRVRNSDASGGTAD